MYARYMCYANGGMYFVNDENTLLVVNYEDMLRKIFPDDTSLQETYQYPNEVFYPGDIPGGETEGTIEWSFETGDFGMDDIYQKYIKRLIIRLKLETNARVRIEIQYDSSGEWRNVIERYATRKRSLEIPVPVARCDHFRLRFSGFGEFILFNIAKVTEEGSGRG